MTCKTIRLSCNVITCFRLFIFSIIWCTITSHHPNYNYKQMEIIDDLPVKSDLEKYLTALEKIVYFVDGHRYYLDIDLCFGIYLSNVNLRNIVQTRGHLLSFQKQVRMLHLVKTNDDIIEYYSKMYSDSTRPASANVLIDMLNLYPDRTTVWPKLTEKFSTELIGKTKFYSRKNLEAVYSKFPKYKQIVLDFMSGYPTPIESDLCLNLLAQNPIGSRGEYYHCQIPYNCLKMMVKGYDYGYGIAHRLLLLLAARYWRNCVILSVQDDKQLIDEICSKMYNELEHISNHEFRLPDLFMEDVSLCTLEGHAQFLRRSWIDELLDFQVKEGCFNLTKPDEETALSAAHPELLSLNRNLSDWSKECNNHETGVAAAMISAALRLIMENYY